MKDYVQEFIKSCERCQRTTKNKGQFSVLHPLPLCTETNQRVNCDLFGPLKTISSKSHVLCITDAHTKFVELVAVPNKEAKTLFSEPGYVDSASRTNFSQTEGRNSAIPLSR